MPQNQLDHLLRDTQGVEIAAEAPPCRVPSPPTRKLLIQFEIMRCLWVIGLSLGVIGLSLAAMLAALLTWENLPPQEVV